MNGAADNSGGGSALTVRAVLLGLVAGSAIAAGGYFNDYVLGLTPLVGNNLPVSIYGPLVLFTLLLAPLARFFPSWLRLRAGEITVIIAIALASAGVATNGMMRFFTPMIGLQARNYSERPGQTNVHLMDYVPPGVLLSDGRLTDANGRNTAAKSFVTGPTNSQEFHLVRVSWDRLRSWVHGEKPADSSVPIMNSDMTRVPWGEWAGPLKTWLPIMLMVMLAGLSLAALVQRQWSRRERLAFPIVEFADTIINHRAGGRSLFRAGGFWVALGVVFAIHLVNGYHAWNPTSIAIPMRLEMADAFTLKFPMLGEVWDTGGIFSPTLFLSVVGFSFFVARDVSLTLGVVGPFNTIFIAILMSWGINLYDGPGASNYCDFLRMGGYVALAIVIFYNGRAFYRAAFGRAIFFGRGEGAWPARGLMLSMLLLVVLLCRLGIAWPVAIVEVLLLLLTFIVLMRIAAETGFFYVHSGFVLPDNVVAFFGNNAMGPKQTLLSWYFGMLSAGDTRVILPSLALHGEELADRHRAPTEKTWPWMTIMVVLTIAIALPVILYLTYSRGISATDNWGVQDISRWPLGYGLRNLTALKSAGTLEASEHLSSWGRLTAISPMPGMLWGLLAGAGLTFLLSAMRLRFPRWPIHPIFIPVLGTTPVVCFSFSFLVGWILRTIVDSFGGGGLLQKLKPTMVGLIAGELLAATFWLAQGLLYCAFTGLNPKPYGVFP